MLSSTTRRASALLRRPQIFPRPHRPAVSPAIRPISPHAMCKRFYAEEKPKEQVPFDPLAPPDPAELDARFGDIPDWKVAPVNPQKLTPYPEVPYDDPQNRRYFNEPVPEEFEVLNVFGPDVHDHVSTRTALLQFFGFWAVFATVCYGISQMAPKKIAVPRSFPYNGLSKEQGGEMWRSRSPEDDERELQELEQAVQELESSAE